MAVQRYKLIVAYRGTRYHGWQAQRADSDAPADADDPQLLTVQRTLRAGLESILNHPLELVGSSRTDAGVHAKGQVVHFDTPLVQIPPENLRQAANRRLPPDIFIRRIEPVADDFHAIRSTIRKRYQYYIWNYADRPIFFSDLAWHRWHRLDIPAMAAAGALLVGEHDFASFARPGHGRLHTVRTILGCKVIRHGGRLVIGVEGTGFLWNMVRIMVGTLVEVGLGRARPEMIPQILAGRDRQLAGPTAPPHGLYLHWIETAARAASVSSTDSAGAGDSI